MIKSALLEKFPSLDHGFLTRTTDPAFRASLEEEMSLAKQVHGDQLIWVTKQEYKLREGDALATQVPGLVVAVQTADCVPILVVPLDADEQPIAVVAIHAGWRGTAARIVEKVASALPLQLPDWGKVKSIVSAIGPCISKQAFEVEQDVVDAFPLIKPEPNGRVNGTEKFLFDLEAENARQLTGAMEELNLPLEVDRLRECTLSHPERYPSYRRDGSTGERIISFIRFSK